MKIQITKSKLAAIVGALLAFLLLIHFYYKVRSISINDAVCYAILLLLCCYTLSKGLGAQYTINPYLLFTIVPLSLLLYDLSVSTHYLVELRQSTYYLAIYNIIMVLLGFRIAALLGSNRRSYIWEKSQWYSSRQLSKQAKVTMLLGLIPTMYGCITGIEYLLSFDLNHLKIAVNSAPLASVFQFFLYLGMMCAFASRQKSTIMFCVMTLVFSMILNFSKTTVVMMCITLLVYFYDASKKNKKVKKIFLVSLPLALVLIFASFTIYNNIRFDYDINQYFGDLGYVGNVSSSMFLPIMYLISPWSNLQYIVDTTFGYSYGLWCLKPFLGYLQLDSLLGESVFELIPRYSAFNTYTYISVFYRDFGFIGSGICSFVLGCIIMKIHKMKLKYPDSPFISTIFALNMYATVMMFFNNHFQQLSYPYTILIISWIWLKFCAGKPRDNNTG